MDHFTNQSKCLHTATVTRWSEVLEEQAGISERRVIGEEDPCSHREFPEERSPLGKHSTGDWRPLLAQGLVWGNIWTAVPCQESSQAPRRSGPACLNPSWPSIWPPGLRIPGSLTLRVQGWTRPTSESSHRAPRGHRTPGSIIGCCSELAPMAVRKQEPLAVAREEK